MSSNEMGGCALSVRNESSEAQVGSASCPLCLLLVPQAWAQVATFLFDLSYAGGESTEAAWAIFRWRGGGHLLAFCVQENAW